MQSAPLLPFQNVGLLGLLVLASVSGIELQKEALSCVVTVLPNASQSTGFFYIVVP